MGYYDQGDVLLFEEKNLPFHVEEETTDVIAHGEATGHAHRLHGDNWRLYSDPKTKIRYLKVLPGGKEPVAFVKHEEHSPTLVPPGVYRIGFQRETDWFREEVNQVVD